MAEISSQLAARGGEKIGASGRAAGCGSACGMSCKRAVQHLKRRAKRELGQGRRRKRKGQQCRYKSILRNVRIVLGMRRNHQTQIRAGPTDIERGGCGACSLLALSHDMTCDRRQATGDRRQASLDFEGSEGRGEARRGGNRRKLSSVETREPPWPCSGFMLPTPTPPGMAELSGLSRASGR